MAGGPTPGFMPAGYPSDLNPNNGSGALGTELSNVLYRVLFGPTSHPHDGSFGATAEGFNPLHREGLLNLASMFVGGPKGDASPMMESLGMHGQFVPYSHETGTALDRGAVNEGPIRPGKGYNPSMQKMVERAHTNPFVKASAAKRVAAEDRLNQLDAARVRAVRQQANHAGVSQKLDAAPVDRNTNAEWLRRYVQPHNDHSAAEIHGPSVVNHPNFIKSLLQRRYQAALGHNHLN